jgi:hypothetical protein
MYGRTPPLALASVCRSPSATRCPSAVAASTAGADAAVSSALLDTLATLEREGGALLPSCQTKLKGRGWLKERPAAEMNLNGARTRETLEDLPRTYTTTAASATLSVSLLVRSISDGDRLTRTPAEGELRRRDGSAIGAARSLFALKLSR